MSRQVGLPIGRTREEDRSMAGAFGNKDRRVKFKAIAHGNHGFATDVFENVGDRLEVPGVSLG